MNMHLKLLLPSQVFIDKTDIATLLSKRAVGRTAYYRIGLTLWRCLRRAF